MSDHGDDSAPRPLTTRARLRARLGTLLYFTIGRLDWTAPPWLRFTGRLLARPFSARSGDESGPKKPRSRRPLFVAVGVGLAAVAAVAGYEYWERTRAPEPERITFTVTEPGLTPMVKDAIPGPLSFHFSGSAARLEKVEKVVTSGIELTPPLRGEWRWLEDTVLQFQPSEEWGIGQEYQVSFDRSLFAEHALMERYDHAFETDRFSVDIAALSFYQDPVDPKLKKVVATLKFSHAVDRTSLQPHVSLLLSGDKEDLPGGKEQSYGFTLSYDELGGIDWWPTGRSSPRSGSWCTASRRPTWAALSPRPPLANRCTTAACRPAPWAPA